MSAQATRASAVATRSEDRRRRGRRGSAADAATGRPGWSAAESVGAGATVTGRVAGSAPRGRRRRREAPELVGGHRGGRAVLRAEGGHPGEERGQGRVDAFRDRGSGEGAADRVARGGARERRRAGERLDQHEPEGVDVAGGPGRLVPDLLGADVGGGADQALEGGERLRGRAARRRRRRAAAGGRPRGAAPRRPGAAARGRGRVRAAAGARRRAAQPSAAATGSSSGCSATTAARDRPSTGAVTSAGTGSAATARGTTSSSAGRPATASSIPGAASASSTARMRA